MRKNYGEFAAVVRDELLLWSLDEASEEERTYCRADVKDEKTAVDWLMSLDYVVYERSYGEMRKYGLLNRFEIGMVMLV